MLSTTEKQKFFTDGVIGPPSRNLPIRKWNPNVRGNYGRRQQHYGLNGMDRIH
jgi:hypothetical protein